MAMEAAARLSWWSTDFSGFGIRTDSPSQFLSPHTFLSSAAVIKATVWRKHILFPSKEKKKSWVMSFRRGLMGFGRWRLVGLVTSLLMLNSLWRLHRMWLTWSADVSGVFNVHVEVRTLTTHASGRIRLTAFGFLQGPAVEPRRVFLTALGWLSSALHLGWRAFPGAAQRHLHDAGTGRVEQREMMRVGKYWQVSFGGHKLHGMQMINKWIHR